MPPMSGFDLNDQSFIKEYTIVEKQIIFAFPSRESIEYGFDRSFYDHFSEMRETFNSASDILKINITDHIFSGNTLPDNLKMPILLAHCYGLYKIVSSYINQKPILLGFSQGEFTAALSAGCLSFTDMMTLVMNLEEMISKHRQRLSGKMIRIIGYDRTRLNKLCLEVDPKRNYVDIATYLNKDQSVISGESNMVEMIARKAKNEGAHFIIPILSLAFHSPLCKMMKGLTDEVFDQFEFTDTDSRVYSCFSGRPSVVGKEIQRNLSKQIYHPIQWETIISDLNSDLHTLFIELGPGCTVSGNTRLLQPFWDYRWIHTVKDWEKLMNDL